MACRSDAVPSPWDKGVYPRLLVARVEEKLAQGRCSLAELAELAELVPELNSLCMKVVDMVGKLP